MAIIGVDIDGTVTAMPAFFSLLCNSLMASGHEVHIITYRFSHFEEQTKELLKELNVPYTKMHFGGEQPSPPAWKGELAKELKLDMMFEDSLENLAAMPPQVARVWVGQQLQDIRWQSK